MPNSKISHALFAATLYRRGRAKKKKKKATRKTGKNLLGFKP